MDSFTNQLSRFARGFAGAAVLLLWYFLPVETQVAEAQGLMKRYWICNHVGARHDQPSECEEPQKGGRWVFEADPAAQQQMNDALAAQQQFWNEIGSTIDRVWDEANDRMARDSASLQRRGAESLRSLQTTGNDVLNELAAYDSAERASPSVRSAEPTLNAAERTALGEQLAEGTAQADDWLKSMEESLQQDDGEAPPDTNSGAVSALLEEPQEYEPQDPADLEAPQADLENSGSVEGNMLESGEAMQPEPEALGEAAPVEKEPSGIGGDATPNQLAENDAQPATAVDGQMKQTDAREQQTNEQQPTVDDNSSTVMPNEGEKPAMASQSQQQPPGASPEPPGNASLSGQTNANNGNDATKVSNNRNGNESVPSPTAQETASAANAGPAQGQVSTKAETGNDNAKMAEANPPVSNQSDATTAQPAAGGAGSPAVSSQPTADGVASASVGTTGSPAIAKMDSTGSPAAPAEAGEVSTSESRAATAPAMAERADISNAGAMSAVSVNPQTNLVKEANAPAAPANSPANRPENVYNAGNVFNPGRPSVPAPMVTNTGNNALPTQYESPPTSDAKNVGTPSNASAPANSAGMPDTNSQTSGAIVRMANEEFYQRNPAMRGQQIDLVKQPELAKEWLADRDNVQMRVMENTLTDQQFYAQNSDLIDQKFGREIPLNSPQQKEWLRIRDEVIRPGLGREIKIDAKNSQAPPSVENSSNAGGNNLSLIVTNNRNENETNLIPKDVERLKEMLLKVSTQPSKEDQQLAGIRSEQYNNAAINLGSDKTTEIRAPETLLEKAKALVTGEKTITSVSTPQEMRDKGTEAYDDARFAGRANQAKMVVDTTADVLEAMPYKPLKGIGYAYNAGKNAAEAGSELFDGNFAKAGEKALDSASKGLGAAKEANKIEKFVNDSTMIDTTKTIVDRFKNGAGAYNNGIEASKELDKGNDGKATGKGIEAYGKMVGVFYPEESKSMQNAGKSVKAFTDGSDKMNKGESYEAWAKRIEGTGSALQAAGIKNPYVKAGTSIAGGTAKIIGLEREMGELDKGKSQLEREWNRQEVFLNEKKQQFRSRAQELQEIANRDPKEIEMMRQELQKLPEAVRNQLLEQITPQLLARKEWISREINMARNVEIREANQLLIKALQMPAGAARDQAVHEIHMRIGRIQVFKSGESTSVRMPTIP